MTNPPDGTDEGHAQLQGMFDSMQFPKRVKATALTPGPDPRLHGYALESDLARNYGIPEILYLALVGELPTDDAAQGLQVAMAFLAAVAIDQGPTHAAFLARLFNAPPRTVLQVTATALAERGHFEIAAHEEFLAWLDTPDGPPPSRYTSDDPADWASVERLRAALPQALAARLLGHSFTRSASIIAVLHASGLRRADQIECVWTLASLGSAFAEGMSARPFAFREYAMDTPAFRYIGGEP